MVKLNPNRFLKRRRYKTVSVDFAIILTGTENSGHCDDGKLQVGDQRIGKEERNLINRAQTKPNRTAKRTNLVVSDMKYRRLAR